MRHTKGRNLVKKAYKTSAKVINDEVKPRIGLYKTDFPTLCESWKNPE